MIRPFHPKNLFGLFLLLFISLPVSSFASVKIGDLYYNLDDTNRTAEVTYENQGYNENYSYLFNLIIPSIVDYNDNEYSVTSIGNNSFLGCRGLLKVDIPNSVTSIGENAFWGCSEIISIEIPNSVISIGNSAFRECSSLASIEIPKSVSSIGGLAFSYCDSLLEINVEDGNQYFKSLSGILYNINGSILLQCPGGKKGQVVIPDSVWKIGDYAFISCESLTRVEIPNSVTSIGNYTFHYCRNLISLQIPSAITDIGEYAFWGCSSLKSIEIPDSVTKIGSYAFEICKSLTNITIPYTVKEIGEGAFSSCDNLLEINVEEGNQNFKSDSGILYNKDFTLLIQCPGGKQGEVIITDSVIEIGNSAFFNCESLTRVEIPNSVKAIGDNAFSNCSGLTSIEIPNSVTSIGEMAFYRCNGFTSIEIPRSVISIEEWVFGNCNGLRNIVIPSSVISIGENAFWGCCELLTIYNYALQPQSIDASVFDGVNINSVTLYVPDESVDLYKAADVWKEFNIVGIQIGGSDPDPDPEIEFEEKIVNVFYIDKDDYTLHTQTVTLYLPVPEEIDGYTFRKWVVLAGDLDDGIQIQALYVDNDTMKTDSILGDESYDATRKVIRAGKVYILKGDKVYDTNGHEINRKF